MVMRSDQNNEKFSKIKQRRLANSLTIEDMARVKSNSVAQMSVRQNKKVIRKRAGNRKMKLKATKKQMKLLRKNQAERVGDSNNKNSDSNISASDIGASMIMEESKFLILKLLGDKSIEESELMKTHEDDANLLQDFDLVILAAPSDDYKNYTQLLRLEYGNMNDENYKTMRLKVLQTLLTIPNIFSTTEFQSKYEEAARLNIKREISELKHN